MGINHTQKIKCELLPLNWSKVKQEFKCTGLNHHYTIFESSEGIGVKWHDVINETRNYRYGFTSAKDAMEWVEFTHHPAQIRPWVKFIGGFPHEPTKEIQNNVPTKP